MSLSAQLRRRRRLPSSKMPQRLLMPVRLCSDAFASRLALLVPWLNPSVGAGQSSILDRHTCPEGILHVQKSLRMCERIQITNGLVSNRQVSGGINVCPCPFYPQKRVALGDLGNGRPWAADNTL